MDSAAPRSVLSLTLRDMRTIANHRARQPEASLTLSNDAERKSVSILLVLTERTSVS